MFRRFGSALAMVVGVAFPLSAATLSYIDPVTEANVTTTFTLNSSNSSVLDTGLKSVLGGSREIAVVFQGGTTPFTDVSLLLGTSSSPGSISFSQGLTTDSRWIVRWDAGGQGLDFDATLGGNADGIEFTASGWIVGTFDPSLVTLSVRDVFGQQATLSRSLSGILPLPGDPTSPVLSYPYADLVAAGGVDLTRLAAIEVWLEPPSLFSDGNVNLTLGSFAFYGSEATSGGSASSGGGMSSGVSVPEPHEFAVGAIAVALAAWCGVIRLRRLNTA